MNDMEEKEFKNDLIVLLTFFVTSAREVIEESNSYGSMRLIDSASRLARTMNKYGIPNVQLDELARMIDNDRRAVRTDMKQYIKMLDNAVLKCLELIDTTES